VPAKLGGSGRIVKGVAACGKDLTESVNSMAGNLTAQFRTIAEVTRLYREHPRTQDYASDVRGEIPGN